MEREAVPTVARLIDEDRPFAALESIRKAARLINVGLAQDRLLFLLHRTEHSLDLGS